MGIPDTYRVERVTSEFAKRYIRHWHYSKGCHNGPSPCYALINKWECLGVLMFATPCSENVRSSIFGPEYKDHVTELHRLHIRDETPHNTESWFISRCLKLLKKEKPQIYAVLSFSDLTEGHEGTIYKATNAFRLGSTGRATFYLDEDKRLRHPRQNGVNITKEEAKRLGWTPVKREAKNRYLWILPNNKWHKKELISLCKYDLSEQL